MIDQEQEPQPITPEEVFMEAVWDALKADTSDLGKQARILAAFRVAVDPAAIREAALQTRIEELVEERDTARRLLAAATQMQTETQVKLTKAVEMLILCGDMFDEVAHPSDPLSVMIKTTLAELEGK